MIQVPSAMVSAVSRIGRNRTAPPSRRACSSPTPVRSRSWMKSMIMSELRTTTPARAMMPTMEAAEKVMLRSQWAGNTPMSPSGTGTRARPASRYDR